MMPVISPLDLFQLALALIVALAYRRFLTCFPARSALLLHLGEDFLRRQHRLADQRHPDVTGKV